MAFQRKGTSGAPPALTKMPAPGQTSSVGPKPPKLKNPMQPKNPNTRDYGKKMPAAPAAPSAPPFGPDTPGGF